MNNVIPLKRTEPLERVNILLNDALNRLNTRDEQTFRLVAEGRNIVLQILRDSDGETNLPVA